jgi:hypothetical protein
LITPTNGSTEILEKEIAELKRTIQNVEYKLSGKNPMVSVTFAACKLVALNVIVQVEQTEPTSLKVLSLERELQAIQTETNNVCFVF